MLSITNKGKVFSRYPCASVEQQTNGVWVVWHISQEERHRRNWCNGDFWPTVFSRSLLGLGNSEDEAWADASKQIKIRGC